MRKEKIHSIFDAKGDQATMAQHAEHAVKQVFAGHYHVAPAAEVKLSPTQTFIGFIRTETNPAEPAAEASVA